MDPCDERFLMGGEHYLKAFQLDKEAQAMALGMHAYVDMHACVPQGLPARQGGPGDGSR